METQRKDDKNMICSRRLQIYHSLRFNGHLPGGLGLACTIIHPSWIMLELRIVEVMEHLVPQDVQSPGHISIINEPKPSFLTGWMSQWLKCVQ